jgi:hypothetical protein
MISTHQIFNGFVKLPQVYKYSTTSVSTWVFKLRIRSVLVYIDSLFYISNDFRNMNNKYTKTQTLTCSVLLGRRLYNSLTLPCLQPTHDRSNSPSSANCWVCKSEIPEPEGKDMNFVLSVFRDIQNQLHMPTTTSVEYAARWVKANTMETMAAHATDEKSIF